MASALAGPVFTATLDRETIALGESATLTLSFQNGQPRAMPGLPAIPNLRVEQGMYSQSLSSINGNVTRTIAQPFILTPTQPGEYALPALQAEVDGQVLTSPPLTLKVVKTAAAGQAQDGTQLAFFKLFVPRKEVYVGEAFSVEFQVYLREGIFNAEDILGQFDGYTGCPIKAEGFNILKTAHGQRRRARVGNAIYGVSTLVTSLTPVKTGPLSLGSMEVNLVLQVPLANQRRNDPWANFPSMFRQVEEKRLMVVAEPETLTALPLPREKAPPHFNGAVGSFTLTVSAGPTNVAMGDPVTVKVQLAGHGAFDSLALPEQPGWANFKTYPPTTKVDTTDPLGLQGTKTFEQVVVPQSAEVKEVPAIAFSFFDPEQKSYRTLSQPAIPLVVRPAGTAPAPTFLATSRAAQENAPASQDIVGIKQRVGPVAHISLPLAQQPWFLALQTVPVLALVASVLWRKRADLLANNPRLRRRRQVAQLVRDGLNDLRGLAAQNHSDQFFATSFHLLQEQLGERLDLPASAITEAVIEERLRPRGVPETVLSPLQELFQTCNLARYAPVKNSQELAAFIPKLEAVLRQLQEVKG